MWPPIVEVARGSHSDHLYSHTAGCGRRHLSRQSINGREAGSRPQGESGGASALGDSTDLLVICRVYRWPVSVTSRLKRASAGFFE